MLLKDNVKGQVIIMGLIFMAIISMAAVSLATYNNVYLSQTRQSYHKEKALALAEAGLNRAIWNLNQQGESYSGETLNFGGGMMEIKITALDAKTKQLEAAAYWPNNVSPLAKKILKMTASAEPPTSAVAFHYGVQVGEGGVEMEEGAKINGNIYSNGNFEGAGSNKSTVSADAWVAGGGQATSNQAVTSTDTDFIFGKATPQIDSAQGFTLSISAVLNKASFFLKKIGSPSNLAVYLVADDNGHPGKNILAQTTLQSSLVIAEYGWVEASFASPASLTGGVLYWLVLHPDKDNNNYWKWGRNSNDNQYPGGTAFYSSDWNGKNPNWTVAGGDLAFKAWLGGVPTFIKKVGVGGEAHANILIDSAVAGNAYYQVLTNTTVDGVQFPDSPDPGPQAFPISNGNISDWKAAAANGGTIEGDFHPPGGAIVALGPKKIIGNLLLDNNQILVLTGTVWVQGHIELDNNAAIRLDPGYAGGSGVILTDNWIHLSNNGIFSGSGDSHSFLVMIALAQCLGGEQTTACTNHNAAVDLHNNVDSTLFYAPNGLIYLHNKVKVKELTGFKIHLSQNTEIDYESGLVNTSFINGPAGAWQAVRGTWQEAR